MIQSATKVVFDLLALRHDKDYSAQDQSGIIILVIYIVSFRSSFENSRLNRKPPKSLINIISLIN